MKSEILAKEKEFHDRWAREELPSEIAVRELFESPVAMENQFILERMGPLAGKRILDIGAGLGESSVYFALQGAKVTAVDLSPEMIAMAKRLAGRFNVEIDGVVTPAEKLDVGREQFDIVYAANIIHHVTDRELFFEQASRALVPGGRLFTIDPIRYNPVINAYRRMADQVRSEDERPLGFEDLAVAGKYFKNVEHREFWILTLSLFLKYYLIDRVHPNQDRYWKRILRETKAGLWWWAPLRFADLHLTRIPFVRRLAWNMVMVGERG